MKTGKSDERMLDEEWIVERNSNVRWINKGYSRWIYVIMIMADIIFYFYLFNYYSGLLILIIAFIILNEMLIHESHSKGKKEEK